MAAAAVSRNTARSIPACARDLERRSMTAEVGNGRRPLSKTAKYDSSMPAV